MHLHAGGQNGRDFSVQLFAREAIGRNAVAKHAAELLLLLENGHSVPHKAQIIRAGKAARPTADDGDALAGGRFAGRIRHIPRVIHGVALESPDIDGRVHHVPAAARLAGMLADIRAGGGYGVVLSDKAHRVRIPSFAHKGNIARNIDARGTQRDAGNRVLQRGEAPVVSDMVHIVVAEALEAAQHQLRRVAADGAVGGRDNRARRFLNGIDRQHGAPSHRGPAPSAPRADRGRCGRERICRTTGHGTAAKRSGTYQWDTVPVGWTQFCAPYPCKDGQRRSGPCLRF